MTGKLDQILRFERSNQLASDLDLEADCEDNNYTDVDTVSLTGASSKNENSAGELKNESNVQLLHTKIVELEQQLASVVQKNLKLTEENEKLKKLVIPK